MTAGVMHHGIPFWLPNVCFGGQFIPLKIFRYILILLEPPGEARLLRAGFMHHEIPLWLPSVCFRGQNSFPVEICGYISLYWSLWEKLACRGQAFEGVYDRLGVMHREIPFLGSIEPDG